VRSDPIESVDPAALWPQGPPTVIVDLVGSPATLDWSAAALATGGRVIVLTTFRDRTTTLDPRSMVFRETSVIASRYANRAELLAAAELLVSGRLRPMIGAVAGPADVLDLHAALQEGTLLARGALRWS
jgi:D-arabinose 1-dehydrogenase-like Zn-dependent alcohol dehydrogenase